MMEDIKKVNFKNAFIYNWGNIFQNVILFSYIVPSTVIFLYETGLNRKLFSQYCGYRWPGALAPGLQ